MTKDMLFYQVKVLFSYIGYRILKPHRNGHGIHSPFLYAFLEKAVYNNTIDKTPLNNIKGLRKQLSECHDLISIDDFGAGSQHLKKKARKISEILSKSSISAHYGELLYRTSLYFQPESIIELGTCLGLGTLYLSSAAPNSTVQTIEASGALVEKAKANFNAMKFEYIQVVESPFDEVFSKILNKKGKADLVFIDGNHRKKATLNYFAQCLPYVNDQTIVIFDDIRWSSDMFEAWLEICTDSRVTLSLDYFRMGMVFFNPKLKKQHFQIYY